MTSRALHVKLLVHAVLVHVVRVVRRQRVDQDAVAEEQRQSVLMERNHQALASRVMFCAIQVLVCISILCDGDLYDRLDILRT